MTKWISFYDLQGLLFGTVMTATGVVFLKSAMLITGQTAGLAVLLSYVLPIGFGALFFLISLPFFFLSWIKRGPAFTLRTFCVVVGISVLTPLLQKAVVFQHIEPLAAAVLAGACSGVGLIALFRHNASAGGLGILALIIEQKTGFRTGWFQLCFDSLVFLAALFVLSPAQVGYSFVGAVVLNALIAWNFRIDQARAKAPKA